MRTAQPTATEQQARLAQHAKNGKDQPQATPYQPMAPYVPGEAEYAEQRYFSRGNANRSLDLESGKALSQWRNSDWVGISTSVDVFRRATNNSAELRTELRIGGNNSESSVTLTANELREIAYRLLDAAYDLEAFPASMLMQRAA